MYFLLTFFLAIVCFKCDTLGLYKVLTTDMEAVAEMSSGYVGQMSPVLSVCG